LQARASSRSNGPEVLEIMLERTFPKRGQSDKVLGLIKENQHKQAKEESSKPSKTRRGKGHRQGENPH